MLQVREASRAFGGRTILSGVCLDAGAGDTVVLRGANGCGKTTLLRCVAGTLSLTGGAITIAGHAAGSLGARDETGVCLSPEQGLYRRLSPRDNLLFTARLRLPRRSAAAAVTALEEELSLGDFATVPVERCSSGMRARVTIARALLGAPKLLLLDEPTRSLDDSARELLWAALDRRPALTCLLASHRQSEWARADQILDLSTPALVCA